MLKSNVVEDALADLNLLGDVVRFKQKFYPVAWASYVTATMPTLKLIPTAVVKASLKKDYAAMRDMIFGEYVDFDVMINELTELEKRLNTIERN